MATRVALNVDDQVGAEKAMATRVALNVDDQVGAEKAMATRVALNVDLGELADEPDELYRLATVVNIACGGHAGDATSMARAVSLAHATGAVIAAHPSYPDRAGFGRKTMVIDPRELQRAVAAQCAALQQIAGGVVRTVKLHGALYHDAARDPGLAAAVMQGASEGLASASLTWVGPPHGAVRERALHSGLAYVREGFADRGYTPDGALIARGQPGALIEDAHVAAQQALALARGGAVDTVCVHSDTANAVEIARAVRAALTAADLLAEARS